MNTRFSRTVILTAAVQKALKEGRMTLQPGQWVEDVAGRKGQYIATRNGTVFVSWADREGETFDDRTQRFCRAIWHQRRKCRGPVSAILGAPASLSLKAIQDFVGKRYDTFNELLT